MKRKYQGLASLVVFIISLTGILCYTIFFADNLSGGAYISKFSSLPDLEVPDKKLISRIEYLRQHLSDLSLLKKNTMAEVDLKLFGWMPVSDNHNMKTDRWGKKQNGFSYLVSLTFFSDTRSFCIIDGKLYSEKALLPDGGKIEKIESSRVLIAKNNKKVWIHIFYEK